MNGKESTTKIYDDATLIVEEEMQKESLHGRESYELTDGRKNDWARFDEVKLIL